MVNEREQVDIDSNSGNIRLSDHESLEALFSAMQQVEKPALDIYGTVSSYLDMKARKRGIPIRGMFELTPLCNLNCKMCYVHLAKDQLGERELLTTQEWKSLIESQLTL